MLLLGLAIGESSAQGNVCTPTNCFEIESLLIDACGLGTQEGLNEMVIFKVGPNPLNTATMTGTWPNTTNLWTGICQNATTAGKVAAINATITSCGRLVEPVGGVLPAGKRVILFSSQTVDQTLHSFANLNDTLIAIFHCGNNLAGNFANAGTGLRTLTLGFGGSCTDAVTYDRALLTGGNGATANFCWNGNATYVNFGCTAPYFQLSTNAGSAVTVCNGTPVNLVGTVSSCDHCFGWYGGTGTFSNPNSLITTYTPGPGETGVVTLTLGQFTSCDTAFSTVPVTFTAPPVFSLGPDTAFCGNFSLPLSPGITALSYAWSTSATTQNITVTSPGTYAVTVTTASGCVVADTIVVGTSTVNGLGFPPDDTICPGGNFFLFPTTNGINYNWSTGSIATGINISNPGTYSLTLTSFTGCVGMDTFQLYNFPATTVDLGNDTTLCPGNTVVLDADPSGNYPGATYLWSTNATSQTITVGSAGTYSVTITTPNQCEAVDTIQVSFNSSIPLSLGPDTAICAGASLLLDAGSGMAYQWSTNATSQTISVNASGTYAVTVTFGVGCQTADTMNLTVNANPTVNLGNDTLYCANLGLTLDAGPGNTYLWSNSATTQTLPLTAGGTYSVTVTNTAGCTDIDTIVVAQGLVPQVSLGPNTTLCPGQTVTLDAGTQATTYLWSTNETTQTIVVTTTGTYWVVGTTNCGTDSAATTVTILPVAALDAGPDDTLCAGDTLSFFNATATAGGLVWTTTGGGTLSDPSVIHPVFTADSTASGPQTFVLTLTDTCGTYTDTVQVEILPLINLTFTLPDSVCYGLPLQISYSGNADSVHWSGLGTFNPTSGSPTVYTPAPGEVGYISLNALAFGPCGTQTFTPTYFGQDTVIAQFGWEPAIIYPGTYVQFQNGVVPPGLPVHWAFGDTFFSVEDEPMHRYYNEGSYTVELIAYGVDGCNDTTELPLIVSPVDSLVPNVFSPNGDGVNDYFDIFNQTQPPTEWFKLSIYDRWGSLMFTTVDPLDRWDGTRGNGGSPVPDGVYYYVVKMKLLKGQVINRAGPVTILR